jgi:hypothetical protein
MNMFRDGSEFDPQYDYFALDSVKSFGLEFNLHSESFFWFPTDSVTRFYASSFGARAQVSKMGASASTKSR